MGRAGHRAKTSTLRPAPRPALAACQQMFADAMDHHQALRFSHADRLYRQVLTINPQHDGSLNGLGLVACQTGRCDLAVDLFSRAISINPKVASYHSNFGNALQALRRPEEAVACYCNALELRPDDPETLRHLGHALGKLRRLEEAASCYRSAIACQPKHPDAYIDLGNLLWQKLQLADAAACYRKAIDLDPNRTAAHSNLGGVLQQQGRPEEAEASLRQAIALKPDYPEAYNNLGSVLQQQEHLDAAADSFRTAIKLNPNYPEAHNNLGNVLYQMGHLQDAIVSVRTAIALRPDYANAHFNLALPLLALGDFAAGWAEYEWRWKTTAMMGQRREFAQPQWRGEAAEGRTLLIHAEQGLGDTIHFCRYAELAAAAGLRVILEVPRPLFRLIGTLPGADEIIARGDDLPPFDLHCPMLSLPYAVRTTLATIPGRHPYLRADEHLVEQWRTRLAAMPNKAPRVGVVWAGNASLKADRRRSLPLEQLAPLWQVPGLHVFSLQKNDPATGSEASHRAQPDAALPLSDLMTEVGDFADTAALIANLDLVIAVDTAVLHLAAALGKPAWLLDRFDSDWRWLVGRRDSPWYPSLRIYRQPRPGDWHAVLAEVARDLHSRFPSATGAGRHIPPPE